MGRSTVDVVLIDDHHLFTRRLTLLLSTAAAGRIGVAGTTGDAARAGTLVRSVHPDLAFVDLSMPPLGGLAVISAVKKAEAQVRVLALSGSLDPSAPLEALRAGAEGSLPKTAEPDDLVHPLMAMLDGWSVVPRAVLASLLADTAPVTSRIAARLAPEEVGLWRAVARGEGPATIAKNLHVSERTAKRMTAALLTASAQRTRIEAAALAGRVRILDVK